MDIVSIGHILNETIINSDGTKQHVLGGPVSYTTVCASRLGAKVGIVSYAGKDINGHLLKVFTDAGVDLTGLNRSSPCTTTNELGYDIQGRKRILRYLKVASPIIISCIPMKYYESKAFYVCGVNFEVHQEVVERLSALNGLLAGDLGGLGGTGQPVNGKSLYIDNVRAYRKYVSHFKIVKVSIDDCILITGMGTDFIPEFLQEVLSWGPKTILFTKGKDGTDIYSNDGVYSVPAYPVHDIVDTTGAGDCFTAGFLVRYLQIGDIIESVKFGSMVSHHVVCKSGGVTAERMPTYEQVMKNLLEYAV